MRTNAIKQIIHCRRFEIFVSLDGKINSVKKDMLESFIASNKNKRIFHISKGIHMQI